LRGREFAVEGDQLFKRELLGAELHFWEVGQAMWGKQGSKVVLKDFAFVSKAGPDEL